MLFKKSKNKSIEEDWLSVSDLMAGLMVVFLFVSIALMRQALVERDNIKKVAVAYQDNQIAIYDALNEAFKDDLKKWEAELSKDDLTFTFKSPDTLFANGESTLEKKYKEILSDFFPRYLEIILKYKDSINEIRIEGHTSSYWNSNSNGDISYFKNMELSQDRTRAVLNYVYNLETVIINKDWIKKHIAAVGLSSSKVIIENNEENQNASRRVSFRVITNSDIEIKKILEIK